MEMMGEVRPPARLNTTIVLPSNPTLRWKRKFFNYLSLGIVGSGSVSKVEMD
jgi:hypothetical protein